MSRTKVLNVTGFLVTGLSMIFHFTYTSAEVGAIALLAWSIANLFTEGGIHKMKLSATVVVNGIGAALGICAAAGWVHFSSDTTAQILLLVSQATNLFTEGGLGSDDDGNSPGPTVAAALVVSAALTGLIATTSCTSVVQQLPDPVRVEQIITAENANDALVKAQTIRRAARDSVAALYVAHAIDAKAVENFDHVDKWFTDAYRELRGYVKSGELDQFRARYRDFYEILTGLAKVAGTPGGGK